MPACVRQLPRAAGVYRFRDARGRVLYVGRATSLRARVASYWSSVGDRPGLARMVPRIASVEAAQCASEHEAAWLERNLLERQLPPWNRTAGGQEVPVYVQLDDGPAMPGLKIVHTVPAPSGQPGTDACRVALDIASGGRPGGSASTVRYFGPYLGGTKTRLAVAALHRVLPLARAADRLTGSARDMARSRGIRPADRASLASAVAAVLDREPGAVAALRDELVRRRDAAAGQLAFEAAARLQAELEAVDWIAAEQLAALPVPAEFEVCGWADGLLVCFAMRAGRLSRWTQRACTQARATSRVAATPPAWTGFAHRNAVLAARLMTGPAGPDVRERPGTQFMIR